MRQIDKATPIIAACLLNAERLLDAAKSVRKPGQNHIAYHLAAVSLEEVGKAVMTLASAVTAPYPNMEDAETDLPGLMNWVEDHERKLFWALFTPGFGQQQITPDQFLEFQSLAKFIHELRLASLYVDAINPLAQREVSDEDLDTILSLAQIRLNMEKSRQPRELDPEQRSLLTWFLRASGDPQMKLIVFSGGSMAKLAEFDGDPGKWMTWLREYFEEVNRTNRELAERELNRSEPGMEERDVPKWQIKIRLKSSSHSIRPKPLAKWNQHVERVKLFPVKDKNEFLVQFTFPKRTQVQELWTAGLQISSMFLIAINVGTFGFFWWYLPTYVSKYYEEIVDIENKAAVSAEPNVPPAVTWGHQALKEADLNNAALVFAHLVRINPDQRQAYDQYLRALGLIAKTDLFGKFEPSILVQFYNALRAGFKAYGDWDGTPEAFEPVTERLWDELAADQPFRTHMTEILRLAGEIASTNQPPKPITMDDAIKMKVYCDLYFHSRARRELGQRTPPNQNAS